MYVICLLYLHDVVLLWFYQEITILWLHWWTLVICISAMISSFCHLLLGCYISPSVRLVIFWDDPIITCQCWAMLGGILWQWTCHTHMQVPPQLWDGHNDINNCSAREHVNKNPSLHLSHIASKMIITSYLCISWSQSILLDIGICCVIVLMASHTFCR